LNEINSFKTFKLPPPPQPPNQPAQNQVPAKDGGSAGYPNNQAPPIGFNQGCKS
jgi:hypothetical protein